jgi:hypothetical protein
MAMAQTGGKTLGEENGAISGAFRHHENCC